MTKTSKSEERDEVLFAFHQECEHPTADDIYSWTQRYPEFADDIRTHAEIMLAAGGRPTDSVPELDQATLSRARSRAMNALFEADQEAGTNDNAASLDLTTLIKTAGTSIPGLAQTMGIDRVVLAEVASGRVRLPVSGRLISALRQTLRRRATEIEEAIRRSLSQPRMGQAKAIQAPTIHTQSFEEVVRASTMSKLEQEYWLGEGVEWTPGGIFG